VAFAGQRMRLKMSLERCLGLCDTERAFWEFWLNHLKSRLLSNHVPVHGTHCAKVKEITTTSKDPFPDPQPHRQAGAAADRVKLSDCGQLVTTVSYLHRSGRYTKVVRGVAGRGEGTAG